LWSRPSPTFSSCTRKDRHTVMLFDGHTHLMLVDRFIREKGGLCIADEVQSGLGRTGENFWAFQVNLTSSSFQRFPYALFVNFQAYGVVPDIVTVGKPLGNGFPLGAVITSREIADSLGEYMTTVRICVNLKTWSRLIEYDFFHSSGEIRWLAVSVSPSWKSSRTKN
jgi:hypothetical protein